MMDLYEAMRKRCSVRSYLDKPVEADKLDRVLNAGRLSPSARNRQERKFVVVRDGERREAVAEASEQPWMAGSPMYCTVPTDPVDCAIAIDHMTLAAVAEGLGTCWIGHFGQDACRRLLGIPAEAKIVELMTLGYPADPPVERPRKPLEEIVCHETFA